MEESKISDPSDVENRFKSLGKKLAKKMNTAEEETQQILSKGVDKHSTTKYLPEDFSNYLMGLKVKVDKPISSLPDRLFKKPIFFGREEYFSRLASELVISGLAYQRVHLKQLKLEEISDLFSKHRPWWKYNQKDVQKAIEVLLKEKIIQRTKKGYLFEPMTLSIDIHEFFSLIIPHLSNYGEIPIRSIHTYIPWDQSKIDNIVQILKENKIVFVDKSLDILFFPEYSRR